MSVVTTERPRFEYLDKLLHQAAVDADFRNELKTHPENFGIAADVEVAIPRSVAKLNESFFELLNEELGQLDIVGCASSCSFGPMTIICDGGTK